MTGYLVPPEYVAALIEHLRPSPEEIARLRRLEAARRRREREQPLHAKARRWWRTSAFAFRRRRHIAREAVALKLAPWLEPQE